MNNNLLLKSIFRICAYMSIFIILIISFFIFKNGIVAINKIGLFNFILSDVWEPENNIYGIRAMILSSIYMIILSIILTIPVGIGTSVYISYFANKKMKKIILFIIEIASGIPSIIYGLFGLMFLVPLTRKLTFYQGQSILVGSIVLMIMILPTMITICLSSIESIDKSYYEASRALGATKEISVYYIIVRAAKRGIVSAIILSISRALGETMAVLMVIGNQPRFTFNLLKGTRVLTTNIILEMGYATGLHKEALISTALILFLFILILNYIFHMLVERNK